MNLTPPIALMATIVIGLSCSRPVYSLGGEEQIRKALQSPESMPVEWLVKRVELAEVGEFCLRNHLTQLILNGAPTLKDHWAQVNLRFQPGDEMWMWNSCLQQPPFPIGSTFASGYCIKRGPKFVYAFSVGMFKVRGNQKADPSMIE